MWLRVSKTFACYCLGIAIFLPKTVWGEGNQYWVQSVQAEVKAGPKFDAKPLKMLKRGDEVLVISRKDSWMEVKIGAESGWLSKLFLTDHKPIGAAELNDTLQVSAEKTTRKRSSSYATSASTRGLREDSNSRRFKESAPPNYKSLQKIETFQINPKTLALFKKAGSLAQP